MSTWCARASARHRISLSTGRLCGCVVAAWFPGPGHLARVGRAGSAGRARACGPQAGAPGGARARAKSEPRFGRPLTGSCQTWRLLVSPCPAGVAKDALCDTCYHLTEMATLNVLSLTCICMCQSFVQGCSPHSHASLRPAGAERTLKVIVLANMPLVLVKPLLQPRGQP